MATKFNLGDLVWAKMKGFAPWPSRIVEPTKEVKRPTVKKPMHCVFFFGTDNYAWVQEEFIFPYEEYKEEFIRQKKSGSFKEALEAIDDYVKLQTKTSSNSPSPEPVSEAAQPTESAKHEGKRKTKQKKDSLKDENSVVATKSVPKRLSSDSSNSSTVHSSVKKPRHSKSDKSNEQNVSNSVGSEDESLIAAAPSSPGGVDVGLVDRVASPSPSHNSLSAARSASPLLSSQYNSASSTPNKTATSGLLMRPTYVSRPVTPPLDVARVSDMLKQKKVVASDLKFGFLGLGIMGQGIVKNLLNSGHQVIVWNRTPSKCRDFVKAGATKGQTPSDVVMAADITFCCVSDPHAAKEMVFGNCGVLQEIGNNKGYVEMTSIDPETSQDIAEAVMSRNGRYLEAPVSGSKKSAEEGLLIVLAAGDRSLFSDCTTCFQAMGKHAFYLGDIGNGSKMNLTLNMLLGSTLSSLAEAMALADRAGLSQRDLVEILELGDLNCPAIVEKGHAIIEGTFPTSMPLQHMQKDLRLALGIGDQLEQPLPMAASACEVFKHAKRMGYSEHDVSAVYIRARF